MDILSYECYLDIINFKIKVFKNLKIFLMKCKSRVFFNFSIFEYFDFLEVYNIKVTFIT